MSEERARPKWTWLPGAKRYYNNETHRFASFEQVDKWAQETLRVSVVATDTLAQMVSDQSLNVADWQRQMMDIIKHEHITKYVAGHGGVESMTQADWGRVGAAIKKQYGYLRGFAQEIANGTLTEAQIRARARMYVRSSRESFELGMANAMHAPQLPANPGDGSTQCLTNCLCHWRIREYKNRWECTWSLDPFGLETCPDCIERARIWSPLVIYKPGYEEG